MIDVLKTRLSSSVSNWYTDDQGNLILESVNGKSAMQLCGEGFMIASSRTDDGKWDWRTFGTGEGFTVDLIVAGFLFAGRIQAGTITAGKLAADVGQSLELSSNASIRMTEQSAVAEEIEEQIGYRVEISTDAGEVLSDYVKKTTLRARVYRGGKEVTNDIAASRFRWKRASADATSDALWNAAHAGIKQFQLTNADVFFSATYTCEISDA